MRRPSREILVALCLLILSFLLHMHASSITALAKTLLVSSPTSIHPSTVNTDERENITIYFPISYNALLTDPSRQLAYTVYENFDTDIYLINADGSEREPLLTGPDNERDPSWSPDGTKLAFSSDYTGTSLIYILDMNTRQITGFAASITDLRLPHWSPDGRYIAYVASYEDYEELWVQAVDSSDPPLRLITIDNTPPGPNITWVEDFVWSPDSSQIALEAGGGTGEVAGYCAPIVINRDGSNLRLLGNWEDTSYFLGCGNRSRSPTWSPDSQWIAFSQKDPEINPYWHFNPFRTKHDGSILERIIHIDPSRLTDYIDYLAWSPDGKYLAFSVDPGTSEVDNSLQLIDLSTKEITHLIDNNDLNWNPAWSPDGQRIAYRRLSFDNSDIYVVDPFQGSIINLTNISAYIDSFAWRPNPSTLPPPDPRDTCSLAGITQPTIVTDFQNGLADFGARPVYTNTSQYGSVMFTYPGVMFTSNTNSQASLAFQSWSGGDTLAVRLRTNNIYQIGLVSDQSVLQAGSWANAVSGGGWMIGLHVDHFGTPNGSIMYTSSTGTFTIGEHFNLPANEEVVVVFRLSEHRFKIYGSDGALLVDILLPAEWFNYGTPAERWWVLGDAWSDSLYQVNLQVFDLCYSESP